MESVISLEKCILLSCALYVNGLPFILERMTVFLSPGVALHFPIKVGRSWNSF